jgi:hypothetical protein
MEFTRSEHTLAPPSERFCLLDLDENEFYLKTLHVVMNDLNTEEFINGNLHLNSRSIVFDPDNESLPLIKIRYNSHFEFECISYEQIRSLFEAINHNKSTLSNIESSSIPRKNSENKFTKVSPRKKEAKSSYSKKGKTMAPGKSLTSYHDKRPSLKSFSKIGSSKYNLFIV